MKKTREVDYRICDECEKESLYMAHCSKCNKELCRNCTKAAPIGDFYFCKDCYNDNVRRAYTRFQDDWTKLKSKQDKESCAMIDNLKEVLEDIVGD